MFGRRSRSVVFGILGLLLWAVAGCGCGGSLGPIVTADRAVAYHQARDTVVAYFPSDQGLCAAVWVAPSKLYTAAHCVEGADPVGLIRTSSGTFTAVVVVLAVHERVDLAVLEAVGRLPEHPYASVGPTPAYGEHVVAIGHPMGLGWTVTEGLVSGSRRYGGAWWLQASTDVFFGNSGGALFDDRGRLVGICSHGAALPFVSHLGMWVHPGYLRAAHRTYVADR